MRATIATSTAVATAAVGIYHLSRIYTAIYSVSSQQISSFPHIPNSLLRSAAVSLTNPYNHVPIHDTRFLSVCVSKSLKDEEILSRFVKGFFAGHVFSPERNLMCIARKEITGFEGKQMVLASVGAIYILTCTSPGRYTRLIAYLVYGPIVCARVAASPRPPFWCFPCCRPTRRTTSKPADSATNVQLYRLCVRV
jgi:hypothetical protein